MQFTSNIITFAPEWSTCLASNHEVEGFDFLGRVETRFAGSNPAEVNGFFFRT